MTSDRGAFLLAKYRKDRENDVSCDFTIVVEGFRFRAHKFMLTTFCKYFEDLSVSAKEKEKEILELKGVSKKTFKMLLDYIYGKSLDLADCSLDDILELYKLADTLVLETFKDDCKAFVSKWLENGNMRKCYALATEWKMDRVIREMIASVSKFISGNPIESVGDLERDEIKLEDVPYDLLMESISLFRFDVKIFQIIGNWQLSQTRNDFVKYSNKPFENICLLEHLHLKDIKEYFEEKMKYDAISSSRVPILQTAVQISLDKNPFDVLSSKFNLQLYGTSAAVSTLKVSQYDSIANTWSEVFYPTPFQIGESFVDHQKRLFIFDSAFQELKTENVKFAIFNLENIKGTETVFELPVSENYFHSAFVDQTKLYVLGVDNSKNIELFVYNMESKKKDVYQLPETLQKGWLGLTVKDGIVYYSVHNQISKFDPNIGLASHEVIYTLSNYSTVAPKMIMTNDHALIYVDHQSVYCLKSDCTAVIVPHYWKLKFAHLHLSADGLFVLTPELNENEMKLSFYGYNEVKNKTMKENVLTYVPKPTFAADPLVKYYLK